MEKINEIVGRNITMLRKAEKLTQLEFAQKLNYSDKSVSKWENGEGLPTLEVLMKICDFFGIALDNIVDENMQLPKENLNKKTNRNKIIIVLMAISAIWLFAATFYLFFVINEKTRYWLFFITAVPLSALIIVIFASIWRFRKTMFFALSVLIWSGLTLWYLWYMQVSGNNVWMVYFVGVPLQIGVVLWSQLKSRK